MKFLFPVNGDCLNENDGEKTEGLLSVSVKVEAQEGHDVYIAGQ